MRMCTKSLKPDLNEPGGAEQTHAADIAPALATAAGDQRAEREVLSPLLDTHPHGLYEGMAGKRCVGDPVTITGGGCRELLDDLRVGCDIVLCRSGMLER